MGSHEGTGGSMVDFMAAIAYGKGVIAAEQYFGRINANTFFSFVPEHFASMFKICRSPKGKLFCKTRIHHKIVVKPDLFGTN